MKKAILFSKIFIAISFLLLICASCSEDEPKMPNQDSGTEQEENTEEKIEYYVKYESIVSIPISRPIYIDLDVITEKGKQSLSVDRTWEGVFGPFNELTTLAIRSRTTGYNTNSTHYTGRISICRGNQPFILKAEKCSNGTSYTVSYTVTKEDLK